MTLDENDYLTFQLFTASKTPRIKNGRIRSWILSIILLLSLAFLFYESNNDALAVYFLILSGVAAIFYPMYSRWRYKSHYLKFIRDTFKNRFGESCELIMEGDTIITKDRSGEFKMNKSEIEEINEIKDYYFLKTRTGASLIISKRKSGELERLGHQIKSLVDNYGVKHNVELDWRWR
jgi:hypothetical protein